jgi:hypothetical protein
MERFAVLCILIVLGAPPVFSQSAVGFDMTLHAGVPLNDTLQPAFCCTTAAGFISHETDSASYLAGLSAGVLLRDRIQVTFGAVYIPVSFRTIGTTCCPIRNPVSPRRGTSWEFPLLGDYRWLSGSFRPFTGGGLVLANRTTGGKNQSPSPVLNGGVEWSKNRILVRPELRYIHFPADPGSDIAVGRPRTQLQFLVGVGLRR